MEKEYFNYIQRVSKYKDILREIEEVIDAEIKTNDLADGGEEARSPRDKIVKNFC